ncbi:MAG: biotin synthase BioB [Desulfobacteraceae bacterium]|nr:biotin synthase BioB [Desulfobacteraceae bacterium]
MPEEIYLNLAKTIIKGDTPKSAVFSQIANLTDDKVFELLPGANLIRTTYFNNKIHLCTICNGKSGKCSEDCSFCAQSKFHNTEVETYSLLSKDKMTQGALDLEGTPVNRYSIVTSGKGLPKKEIKIVSDALAQAKETHLSFCASLGIIDDEDFKVLKQSGVTRYHHNLEAARSHFDTICTTHTFDQRINTIKAAQKAGLSVCAGGIFGMGESNDQILEMALELKNLGVDAIPLNFLSPIPGTPLEKISNLTPLKCLKIIALFRYVCPDKEIIICGGREANLGMLHPLIFYAGSSGIMTGNYLTTDGRQMENDLEMLKQLQLTPRA